MRSEGSAAADRAHDDGDERQADWSSLSLPPRPPLPPQPPPPPSLGTASEDKPLQHALSALGLTALPDSETVEAPRPLPPWQRASTWTVVYGLLIALIAFWPQHVDKGMGWFLTLVSHYVPILTYQRIEFGSNILLFVPLGVLLAVLLPRQRHLVVPIGFLVSLTIESGQGIFLAGRTASVSDLISNTAGACIGLLGAEIISAVRRRRDR